MLYCYGHDERMFLSHDQKKKYRRKGCSLFIEVAAPAEISPEIVKRMGADVAAGQSNIEGFF